MKKIFLISLLTFTNMLFTLAQKENEPVNLKIIVTTDVHGAIFPFDLIENKEVNNSLAQVYTYVSEQRAKKNQEVLLLDNGDFLQGQPTVYYYNFEKTTSKHICSEVMNFMKYDAGSIGNHDIEAGHPVYDKLVKEFKYPWICANAVFVNGKKPYFRPYTIIKRKGIKIAILGLITPAIPNWLPKKIWEGMQFDDMVETAKKWVKIIKEKEEPDLIVGLFHAGTNYNYNNQNADTPLNENASKLVAEKVGYIDIVFAGHDHQIYNATVKNPSGHNTYVVDPKCFALYAGVADITFKYDKNSKKYRKEIKTDVVDLKYTRADESFLKKFNPAFEEVKAFVSKPIGKFTKTISIRDAMFGNSAFIDLIHQVQFEITGADISFADPLSFDATIKEGDVFVRDMFKLYKFENLLYTMEMTGQEIQDYLEFSYATWFNQMKNENDHLLLFIKDENTQKEKLAGRFFNFSSAAGINYIVDVSKAVGERVKITGMSNGQNFDFHKKYKVAVNSYRGNGGGYHLTQGAKIPHDKLADRVISSTEKDMRYYLMQWIEKQKTVIPKAYNNWKIIPEQWWEKGKERDYKQIYGNY